MAVGGDDRETEHDAPGHEPDVASAAVLLATALPMQAQATVIPSFEAVYDENFAFVWRSLRRLGVPDRSLDDAAQDVFVVVHRRLKDYEGRASMRSWLFAIARRVAHDHRRRIGRKERTEELKDGVVESRGASPAEQAERGEAVKVLHDILGSMDDDKREVFVLAELEQMTVPEIAEAIAANVNTVYSRLRAARQAFEAALARRAAKEGGRP